MFSNDHRGIDNDAEMMAPTDKRLADSPRSTVIITAAATPPGWSRDVIKAQRRLPRTPLNQEDERNAEQHVVQHGAHCNCDQVATVIEGVDPHAGGRLPSVLSGRWRHARG